MSLFTVGEWWSVPAEQDEEYDVGCLCVANVDNAASGDDKVVTGSFSGLLRVWRPRAATFGEASEEPPPPSAAYGPEDLLLEQRLGAPILQVEAGAFAAGVPGLCLAVLHPHKLSLYRVVGGSGDGSEGEEGAVLFHRLERLGDHEFAATGPHFTAANFCFGPVGSSSSGSSGSSAAQKGLFSAQSSRILDSIVVQSMDCQVVVYAPLGAQSEDEDGGGGWYRRQLEAPGTLLPGPLSYLPGTDALVTSTSDGTLVAYRFSTLRAAVGSDTSAAGVAAAAKAAALAAVAAADATPTSVAAAPPTPASKRALPDYTINIGEEPVWLGTGRLSTPSPSSSPSSSATPSDIAVVGSRSLLCARATAAAPSSTEGGPSPEDAALSAFLGEPGLSIPRTITLQKRYGEDRPLTACLFAQAPVASASHPSTLGVSASSLAPAGDGDASGAAAAAASHGLLLATDSGQLRLYSPSKATTKQGAAAPSSSTGVALDVAWAAHLPMAPVALRVGRFGGPAGSARATAGLIVGLSCNGELAVWYLGTQPPPLGALGYGRREAGVSGAAAGADKPGALSSLEAEHRRLLGAIKDAAAAAVAGAAGAAAATLPRLVVSVVPSAACEDPVSTTALGVRGGLGGGALFTDAGAWTASGAPASSASLGPIALVTVTLSLANCPPGVVARDVSLAASLPAWVAAPPAATTAALPPLRAGEPPAVFTLPVRACSELAPASAAARVSVSYRLTLAHEEEDGGVVDAFGDEGEDDDEEGGGEGGSSAGKRPRLPPAARGFRLAAADFSVPLIVAAAPVPPSKAPAAFKLTLGFNRPAPPPLAELFSDSLVGQPPAVLPPDTAARITAVGAAALTFRYRCGGEVSLLASKQGGRIRVQGDSLEALALVTQELVARLGAYYGPGGKGAADTAGAPPFAVSYGDPLPLADLFTVVDAHWAARQEAAAAAATLADRAHTYRLVTKRLVGRYKDRNPAALGGLDALLDVAHGHVTAAGAAAATAAGAVTAASHRLAAALRLVATLACAFFGLTGEDAVALEALLAPGLAEASGAAASTAEGGWEEAVEAGLAHVLRAIAKRERRAAKAKSALPALPGVAASSGEAAGGGEGKAGDDGEDEDGGGGSGGSGAIPGHLLVTSAGAGGLADTSRLKAQLTVLVDKLEAGVPLAALVGGGSGDGGAKA